MDFDFVNSLAKYQDKLTAFIAVVHTRMKSNYFRVSRLVVLPDYQGIGVGKRLLNFIAQLYTSQFLSILSVFARISEVFSTRRSIKKQKASFGGIAKNIAGEPKCRSINPSCSRPERTLYMSCRRKLEDLVIILADKTPPFAKTKKTLPVGCETQIC